MSLPDELQRLPPQALDLIRYLGRLPEGASVETIMAGTGLSDRGARKAIRRLVTRYFVAMPHDEYYVLTPMGRDAAEELRLFDGDDLSSMPVPPEYEDEPRHDRRLVVLTPRELVIRSRARLRIGFDAPGSDDPALVEPARVVLRLSAPGCDVDPVKRPLEVPVDESALPVLFNLVPRQPGTVRVKVEVFQVMADDVIRVGGMYFDRSVAEFPTPLSSEIEALGVTVGLYPGGDDEDS